MNTVKHIREELALAEQRRAHVEAIAEAFRASPPYPDFYAEEYAAKVKDMDMRLANLRDVLQKLTDNGQVALLEDPARLAALGEVTAFYGKEFDGNISLERLQNMQVLIADNRISDEDKRFLISLALE